MSGFSMRTRGFALLSAAMVVVSTAVVPASTWQQNLGLTGLSAQAAHSVPTAGQPVRPVEHDEASKRATTGSPAVSWPAAGTAEVNLDGSEAARAGDLPVRVSGRTGDVRVQLLDRETASKAGVQGLIFRVSGIGGQLSVDVDYSSFRNAYGGDWASRLGVVQLPECALTQPDCAGRVQLDSTNDTAAGRVTAKVVLPGDDDQTVVQSASGPAGGVLLALAAGPQSSAGLGDYSATQLKPSATWQVSQQTGDFNWSYPLKTVPVPSRLTPPLSISYASSRVDGQTASTNNQSSWLGDGWDMWSGYIERRFTSCAENTDDVKLKTADRCWFDENASLVLAGSGGQIIYDKARDLYRLKNDDGSKVERKFGAANGDRDGEHWVITKSDGTRYVFGRNKLDGWIDGKPETQSAWTVPVFGRYTDQPCHNANSWKDSWCDRAWRWNLDHVIDKHGNTITYYYNKEQNSYGRNKNEAASVYTRGGSIDRVEYGTRLGHEYDGDAPAKVVFTTADRCQPGSACNIGTATDFPDVPIDQFCDGTTCPDRISPTFFTTKRLAKVTTKAGGQDVESWTLNHTFPATEDSSSPALWLSGIKHAGHVGGTAELPEVTFDGKKLANRVGSEDGFGGYLPLYKYRLTRVYSESGGLVALDYLDGDCDRKYKLPAAVDSNNLRCFPVHWAPPGRAEADDWFHKYVVKETVETDRTGGAPHQTTTYTYLDDPAWHYTEDEITPERLRTWSDWRGYKRVRVTKGNTQTERLFFRGMNGDRNKDGTTKHATIVDSKNGSLDDWPAAQGFQREEITRNGPDGPALLTVITKPEPRGPTARKGALEAWMTRSGESRTFTALAAGGERTTRTTPTIDANGVTTQVTDWGDDSTPNDDMCTTYTYASNDALWVRLLPVKTETFGTSCDLPRTYTGALISSSRTFYDGSTQEGVVPGFGNVTKSEQAPRVENNQPVYQQAARSSYDEYGRVLDSWDALDRKSSMTYEHTAGLLTKVRVTNAKGFAAATDMSPVWGEPTVKTDANNGVTTLAYDPLGRLAEVRLPGRRATQTPNVKFEYFVNKDAITAVATTSLTATGANSTSYALYDGLLRPRQTQEPSPNTGRLITDTFYNEQGVVGRTASSYYDKNSLPTKDLVTVPAGNERELPAQTINTYDALGRVLTSTFRGLGVDKWTSTNVYGGDRISTTPPPGGTATMAITDARGRTTELRQYKNPVQAGDYDTTNYEYSRDGDLLKVTDPAGNKWESGYDLLGRKTSFLDPDRGLSTSAYDAAGQLTSTTDSMNRTLTFGYDELGRKKSVHQGTVQLTGWNYDTIAKGLLTSSTRYTGGQAYTTEITGYDPTGKPLGAKVVLPTVEGKLAEKQYETKTTYAQDGSVNTVAMPAAGDLAAETLQYLYTKTGQPNFLSGSTPYVEKADYNEYGQLSLLTLNSGVSQGTKWVQQNFTYEADTRRLSQTAVLRNVTTGDKIVGQSEYRYDPAGNVRSILSAPTNFKTDADGNITSLPNGNPLSVDYQCFNYDHVQQLTEAWAGISRCAAQPSQSVVGGPAGYWQSFTYDKAGNRLAEVEHTATGDTRSDYAYPATGGHLLRSVTSQGPSGQQLQTYDYHPTGDTKTRMVSGTTHDMTWDAEGHLATDTAGGQTTSFVYDAEGNRLLRKDPTGTTLYLAGQEVRLAAGSTTPTATRSYSLGSQVVAVRTKATLTWLAADHQGTQQYSIKASDLAVERRRQTPFGEPRGAAPASWPEEKGFVGGTTDPSGLTHLGAREYDPSIGRFISADPVMDLSDPQQINGYSYGNSSPLTFSDASGLLATSCMDDGTNCAQHHHNDKPPSQAYVQQVAQQTQQNQQLAAAGVSQADLARAQEVERQSWVDVALEAGGEVLKEVLGINDMVKCFGEGDFGACASMVLGAIPWGKILKAGKIVKALDNAVGAVKSFLKQREWAKNLLGRAREVLGRKRDTAGDSCLVNSFTPETQVLMADGSRKPLAEVKVGDTVLATDPETGKTDAKVVARVIIGEGYKNLVEVTVDTDGATGSATGQITATDGHPFWLPDEQRWAEASELTSGQNLFDSADSLLRVTAEREWIEKARVFNLTVEGIHTYYVLAGDMPVLVHNCGVDEPSDELLDLADSQIGKTNVASEVTAENGMKGRGISQRRGLDELTPQVRGAVDATGHHGGCGEIGALCQIEREGGSIWGAKAQSVDVMGGSEGYGPERHGAPRAMCPSCQKLFSYLKKR
ncbi:polymorphic toxin-type HINT domain-containing protein [Lentzea sp. BCCO 10_0856]|uniref:Polymorphic toxin-type HINT domain-containing protein n=1 Tax=Lentzea miocenica TaxID=3095431 RepID=A0ABU4T9G8_9PSEU|nr:polymorphic toxin-type HINT domain-containing protein [Lentzea sp. BCCO 10_0856]MDX8034804.1 polymorphic toxin-type HINT domain-containing protein [Lentzea sp. BCCO 10_0856]